MGLCEFHLGSSSLSKRQPGTLATNAYYTFLRMAQPQKKSPAQGGAVGPQAASVWAGYIPATSMTKARHRMPVDMSATRLAIALAIMGRARVSMAVTIRHGQCIQRFRDFCPIRRTAAHSWIVAVMASFLFAFQIMNDCFARRLWQVTPCDALAPVAFAVRAHFMVS